MRRLSQPVALVLTLVSGLLVLAVPTSAAEAPEVFTVVEHDVTLASEFFPDDICGPRAVTETVTNTVQVNHLAANDDGSFHFIDFETGFVHSDFVDPSIPDTTLRRTNTEAFNLTPGGTFTATETIQVFDATLRIISAFHLTIVRDEPKVEREITLVRGCP